MSVLDQALQRGACLLEWEPVKWMLNLAARGKQNVEKDSMLSNSFDVKLQLAKKLTVVRLPSIILAFTVKSK